MLGFCHAPPADDVTRPTAAHVIYRQKRLKQKTRALNMTKTAFKQGDLMKRVSVNIIRSQNPTSFCVFEHTFEVTLDVCVFCGSCCYVFS